jgi:hypothetical protein
MVVVHGTPCAIPPHNSNNKKQCVMPETLAYSWRCEMCVVLVGKLERRDHLEDQGVDRMILLKWVLGQSSV